MKTDVLILGGGASGLMAAVALARAGKKVLVLEKNPRIGKKLLATGNGRCNFTNLTACADDYFGSRALVLPAMESFPPQAVIDVFRSMGVDMRQDDFGRCYPMSNQASSVLDALRLSLAEAGGEVWTDFSAKEIRPGFTVTAGDGRKASAPVLLVAAGGEASPKLGGTREGYRLLEEMGHRSVKRRPALVPLRAKPIPALKGIRVQCTVALWDGKNRLLEETGEILFADYGISGIAAMQMARFVRPGMELSIRLIEENGYRFVEKRKEALPERLMEDFLNGCVPRRVGQVLCKLADIELDRPARTLTRAEISRLGALLNDWRTELLGTKGFDDAQVVSGGLAGEDFDPETLESRLVPGLYCAGEILDVDGPCGGYNLQWAWASALLAAKSILEKQ